MNLKLDWPACCSRTALSTVLTNGNSLRCRRANCSGMIKSYHIDINRMNLQQKMAKKEGEEKEEEFPPAGVEPINWGRRPYIKCSNHRHARCILIRQMYLVSLQKSLCIVSHFASIMVYSKSRLREPRLLKPRMRGELPIQLCSESEVGSLGESWFFIQKRQDTHRFFLNQIQCVLGKGS